MFKKKTQKTKTVTEIWEIDLNYNFAYSNYTH